MNEMKLQGVMSYCLTALVVLVLSMGVIFAGAAERPKHNQKLVTTHKAIEGLQQSRSTTTEDRESEKSEEAVLNHLRTVFGVSGRGARLYYSSNCKSPGIRAVPFPRINVQVQQKGETGLAAVRGIFTDHRNISVTEEKSGTIKIRIGAVPDAILQTKISLARLTRLQQYNPQKAIDALEETKEARAAMRKLGFQLPVTLLSGGASEPEEGWPHLPATLRNVTIDEAFDLIANTFKGIVVYGACEQPSNGERLFRTHFVQVTEIVTTAQRPAESIGEKYDGSQ
jgi:hypothetical protein